MHLTSLTAAHAPIASHAPRRHTKSLSSLLGEVRNRVAVYPMQLALTECSGCIRVRCRVTVPAAVAVAAVVQAAAPLGATRGVAPAPIMAAVARPGRVVARLLTVDSPGAQPILSRARRFHACSKVRFDTPLYSRRNALAGGPQSSRLLECILTGLSLGTWRTLHLAWRYPHVARRWLPRSNALVPSSFEQSYVDCFKESASLAAFGHTVHLSSCLVGSALGSAPDRRVLFTSHHPRNKSFQQSS